MSVNNFDVLKRMCDEKRNIRLCSTITKMDCHHKRGTEVSVGVPGNVCFDIDKGKLNAILLVFDMQQFNELKALMEREATPPPSPPASPESPASATPAHPAPASHETTPASPSETPSSEAGCDT